MCQTLKQLLTKARKNFKNLLLEDDPANFGKHNIYHVPVLSINEQHLTFPEALR